MVAVGRKPKENRDDVRHRNPVLDWTDVLDEPFEDGPDLPDRYLLTEARTQLQIDWPPATVRWWAVVSRMPHCSLWTEADWQFALDTAEVHARWAAGGTGATELRIRESRMGTTADARRDLRIRYVRPSPAEVAEAERPSADVVQLDDFRDLYG